MKKTINLGLRMKKLLISSAVTMALIFGALSAKADNLAYMAASTGEFGTINLDTGTFSLLGNSGQVLWGLGVANATLYAVSYWNTNPGSLYTVNPADGSLTLVGTSGIPYNLFGFTPKALYAVAFDGNLYSIDPATGAATLIGPTGISFDGSGSLAPYASSLYLTDA